MVSVQEVVRADPLTAHKGSSGRLLVIGGSLAYVGAPYYVAKTAMRCGVDLVYVACFAEALTPLKVLLPEAIVVPLKSSEWRDYVKKVDAISIGSGLGTDNLAELVVKELLGSVEGDQTVVIDGDAIVISARLMRENRSLIKPNVRYVLTPNVNELRRLFEINPSGHINDLSYRVEKGPIDKIVYQSETIDGYYKSTERRFGGQGDLLAGAIAAGMAFIGAYKRRTNGHGVPHEIVLQLLRMATAYVRINAIQCRGVPASKIASDVLEQMRDTDFMQCAQL
eukprot:Blabericola_migrator_1__5909@NODE_2990_length_2138_cov_62_866731_g1870_i0_p1_GENE_NODE_2990_length_2138_cov_62_866731_g1870_i0NODE_2990_length_2138_cov_62_866731_g1870_i0_p1_ORF_typecomplete_len281_score48_11Carb_kinase/PF01256_17/2_6e38Phos_pyr_kin/PF08543_12/0_26Phos_pyr_kin/PF08543_12/1_1e03_NODE_2990_length_2138_cov_62_866731_g1870_i012432085